MALPPWLEDLRRCKVVSVVRREVPVGSKEHAFLDCLAGNLDLFVPYADIKHHVLTHSGSTDSTEEATFCQKLKSRVKRKIPQIDRLITTTNKADGYRLRARVQL